MHSLEGQHGSDATLPVGKAALIESVGGQPGYADLANPDHRRRNCYRSPPGMTMTGTQSPDRDDPGTRNGAVTTRLDTSFQMRFRVIGEENRITTNDMAGDIRLDPRLNAILAGITVEPVGDVGPARWSGRVRRRR